MKLAGDWENGSVDDVLSGYGISREDMDGMEVLFAYYSYEDYSGYSFVLLRDAQSGELFEVNASHCSCYGLEDQWEPEPVTLEELIHRVRHGSVAGLSKEEDLGALLALSEASELDKAVAKPAGKAAQKKI